MTALRFGLITLVTLAIVHLGAVWASPRLIMGVALHRLGSDERESNTLHHPPRIDADSRDVVRPSPDLAYSVCLFDVSSGPVRVTAPVSGGYMSVSGFAANTDNFFVVNDREVRPGPIDVVLLPGGESVSLPAGARGIEAPSERGLVLIRIVIESDADWAEVDRLRHEARCESFRGS